MSANGHVVTSNAIRNTGSTPRRGSKSTSEKVRLNGNVARRKGVGQEFFWWDTELSGFGLRVFATGAKCWFVQFRLRGKQELVTFGRPPETRAEKARALARAQLARAALGGLPVEPKVKCEGIGVTLFRDYAPRFWDDHARHWRPSTRRENRRLIFEALVGAFGRQSVDAIRKSDALRWRDSWPGCPDAFNLCR
ncbi:MAG: Arm DNA-binding domain-containing protein [Novosphingobium sp.]